MICIDSTQEIFNNKFALQWWAEESNSLRSSRIIMEPLTLFLFTMVLYNESVTYIKLFCLFSCSLPKIFLRYSFQKLQHWQNLDIQTEGNLQEKTFLGKTCQNFSLLKTDCMFYAASCQTQTTCNAWEGSYIKSFSTGNIDTNGIK